MPDPVWQIRLRYTDQQSGMTWTIVNHRINPLVTDIFTIADAWNDAYMAACAETVSIVDMRVSDVALMYDMFVVEGSVFATPVGALAGVPTEISSYAKFTGFGSALFRGQSSWKLHGLGSDLAEGSKLAVTNAQVIALKVASNTYFRQYRPEAGENVPAVSAPTAFGSVSMTGMYNRRLGRSFLSPGQQRRYTRTAPAV